MKSVVENVLRVFKNITRPAYHSLMDKLLQTLKKKVSILHKLFQRGKKSKTHLWARVIWMLTLKGLTTRRSPVLSGEVGRSTGLGIVVQ